MSISVFRSKSQGPFVGYNHLRRNLAGSWYWQFWIAHVHLVIGNATRRPRIPLQTKLGAVALLLLLYPLCFTPFQVRSASPAQSIGMIACSASQVENEINVIIEETGSIIAVADPSATWLDDFSKAANLLKVDEAAWIKGGAVQDVINVLNDIEGITALISPLVPYASLISVLVAGIDAALALLLPAPTAASPSPEVAHAVGPRNPFKGNVTVTSAADSKAQWNAIVKTHPALAKAKI